MEQVLTAPEEPWSLVIRPEQRLLQIAFKELRRYRSFSTRPSTQRLLRRLKNLDAQRPKT